MTESSKNFIAIAAEVFDTEVQALKDTRQKLGPEFSLACKLVLACAGRVVVVGMGKSGHIAGKLAATLASTGTPAFFVHPGEASHGDLGMITPQDLIIAISNSGETPEILTLLPILKRIGVKLLVITGNMASSMAKQADAVLDASVAREACPMNLAPTASTTAALAMGDALAIAVLQARGVDEQDFARSHPGGVLGRRLLVYVEDIMRIEDNVPVIAATESIKAAIIEMSRIGMGMTSVVDSNGRLVGIFTDGDLRRILDQDINLKSTPVSEVMTQSPVTTAAGVLAAELVSLMRDNKIQQIVVLQDDKPVGAINMQDMFRAGIV
ncbi:MAG: KpsF/GutQ family sugar-phosphate isomerase [Proteobacteria bacterium]|jgi:arabinose-5-phosphate isomerase|nr:KpsF/GutQ family sugar-phosphate isomerase [Pseudomonadota bacterium]